MKNLFKIQIPLAAVTVMMLFASCGKSELPEAPETRTEAARARIGGTLTFYCPSNPTLMVSANYSDPTGDEGWLSGDVALGTAIPVPDVTVDGIYFSYTYYGSASYSYVIDGPVEIIREDGPGRGTLRFKYSYDANGNITPSAFDASVTLMLR